MSANFSAEASAIAMSPTLAAPTLSCGRSLAVTSSTTSNVSITSSTGGETKTMALIKLLENVGSGQASRSRLGERSYCPQMPRIRCRTNHHRPPVLLRPKHRRPATGHYLEQLSTVLCWEGAAAWVMDSPNFSQNRPAGRIDSALRPNRENELCVS